MVVEIHTRFWKDPYAFHSVYQSICWTRETYTKVGQSSKSSREKDRKRDCEVATWFLFPSFFLVAIDSTHTGEEQEDIQNKGQGHGAGQRKVQFYALSPAGSTASLQTCCTCTIGLVQVVERLLWLT